MKIVSGRDGLMVDGEVRNYGAPVPEAADWSNIKVWIDTRMVLQVPDDWEPPVFTETVDDEPLEIARTPQEGAGDQGGTDGSQETPAEGASPPTSSGTGTDEAEAPKDSATAIVPTEPVEPVDHSEAINDAFRGVLAQATVQTAKRSPGSKKKGQP